MQFKVTYSYKVWLQKFKVDAISLLNRTAPILVCYICTVFTKLVKI